MKKLDKNLSRILYIQLALENYCLISGTENDKVNEAFNCLNNFRSTRKTMGEKEQVKKSNKVLSKLNCALDSVGRDKFIFYDDGDINYISSGSSNQKGGKVETKTNSNDLFNQNFKKILKIKSEIETYEIASGNINKLSNEAFKALNNLEKQKNTLDEIQKINMSNEILNKFTIVLEEIKNN